MPLVGSSLLTLPIGPISRFDSLLHYVFTRESRASPSCIPSVSMLSTLDVPQDHLATLLHGQLTIRRSLRREILLCRRFLRRLALFLDGHVRTGTGD